MTIETQVKETKSTAGKGALLAVGAAALAGLNSCKGTSDCKTAENACKGQNVCKGHGFLAMTKADCDAKGGKVI